MARDTYNFNIEANNQQAKDALEELKRLAEDVETASSNLGRNTGNQEHLSELIGAMTEASQKFNELKRMMSDDIVVRARFESGGSSGAGEMRREMEKELRQVEQEYTRLRNRGQRGFFQHEQAEGTRVQGRYSTNPNVHRNQPTESRQELDAMRRMNRTIDSEVNAMSRIGQNAYNTGWINNSQASRYRQLTQDLAGERHQGASIETIMSGEDYTPEQGSTRANVTNARERARERNRQVLGDMEQLQSREDSMDPREFELQMGGLQEELRDTERTVEQANKALHKLDEAVETVSNNMEMIQNRSLTHESGSEVTEKADRNTVWGRMQERQMVIGAMTLGAAAYAVTSQQQSGRQTLDGIREDTLHTGFQTGNYDFRGLRQDYMERGNELGYRAQDTFAQSESIMASLGYIDQANLESNMDALAEFSKFSAAGQNSSMAFMESMYGSGAISTAEQARAIQEGFVGGIKASGMEGREREQIDALTAINESVARGREMTEEEARSRQAMAQVMSGTGNRALQGTNLANFVASMDSAIRGADPFSTQGMLLGMGSGEFGGTNWLYDYIAMQQEGLTPESFNTIQQNLQGMSGDTEWQAGELVSQFDLIDTVDVRALEELLREYPDGLPVGEEAEALLNELQNSGSSELSDREEGYMDSHDQVIESQQAYQEQLETLLNDNKWMEFVDEVKQAFSSFGSGGAGRATLTAIGTGLISGLTTLLGSGLTSALGNKIFGSLGGSSFMGSAGGAGGGILGKIGGGIKGIGGTLAGGAKGLFGGLSLGKLGGGIKSIGGSLAGGTSNWLPGVGATLTAVDEIGNVISAEEGTRARTATEGAGRVAGGWAGAKGGASAGAAAGTAIGTAILPGAGSAVGAGIGTLVGGVGGFFGGRELGGTVGGYVADGARAVGNFFGIGGGDDPEPEELEEDPEVHVEGAHQAYADSAQANEERALVSERLLTEQLREDNINRESDNLERQETLLSEIRELLRIAASQNGIIGSMNGSGAGGGLTGSAGGVVGDGQYWTNEDITQHDLGSTSNALTAQELDAWIDSRAPQDSLMRGMGETFMKAGQESGLDPRYLVSHAAIETGWGTSNIARDKNNFYGIGAFDSSPYESAYGYDGAEAGIIGGAKWIADNYYDEGQTTLDQMANGPKSYATDPEWANKIASTMRGSEGFTSPSVNVNATVNYQGTGDPEADGAKLATGMSNQIATSFRHELTRTGG